jgi:hypothetical protein
MRGWLDGECRRKILVAGGPQGQRLARRALASRYELHVVSTVEDARRALADSEAPSLRRHSSFDLVIGDLHFDHSRMFELLTYVRENDHYDELSFLVIKVVHRRVALDATSRTSAELLGAYGFLDLGLLSDAQADAAIVAAVEEGFERRKCVAAQRMDPRPPGQT